MKIGDNGSVGSGHFCAHSVVFSITQAVPFVERVMFFIRPPLDNLKPIFKPRGVISGIILIILHYMERLDNRVFCVDENKKILSSTVNNILFSVLSCFDNFKSVSRIKDKSHSI